jgi:hypothetical protein
MVPGLGVVISVNGPFTRRVLGTLTRSPRTVALASGSPLAVPSSWRSVSFAGLRFSVPPGWPVKRRTAVTPGLGGICTTPGVAFWQTAVVLSTDVRPVIDAACPLIRQTPLNPLNGTQVDSGLTTEPLVTLVRTRRCLDPQGLIACPATSPGYPILVLRVAVPGRDKPDFVSIGLAGNGMVARTILHSLRSE